MTISTQTLANALETLGFHAGEIMTYRPSCDETEILKTGFGLGGAAYGEGCPSVYVEVTIQPTTLDDSDRWGVWAQCTVNGKQVGNRCGARNELMALYAPVIAWIASHAC